MELSFTKMAGCGNDFLLVEAADLAPATDLSELGRRLCDRQCGIGADGLIVLQPPVGPGADYRVAIVNASGLPAEMCGNGARCVARYVHDRGLAGATHAFETPAGLIRAEVGEGGQVRVELTEPTAICLNRRIDLDGAVIRLDTVDTGVPHAVMWVEAVERADVGGLGPRLRHHPAFAHGTNVNFVEVADAGLAVRTYERGVEAETLACGTGSAAAAILGHLRGYVDPPVRVRTRHGAVLVIDFAVEDERIRRVTLAGPTTYICRGQVCAEILD